MTIRLRLTIYWAAIIATMLLIAGIIAFLLFERQQWGALDGALDRGDVLLADRGFCSYFVVCDALARGAEKAGVLDVLSRTSFLHAQVSAST